VRRPRNESNGTKPYVVARSNFEKLMQKVNQQISEGMDKGSCQQHHHAGMKRRGFFIVLEGPEGLRQIHLDWPPWPSGWRAAGADPRGGSGSRAETRAAEIARQALLDPGAPPSARWPSSSFIWQGPVPDLVQTVIQPAPGWRERVVLSDRFALSTEAYQMAGRRVWIQTWSARPTTPPPHGLRADLTLILDLPPELGQARQIAGREAARPVGSGGVRIFIAESLDYYLAINDAGVRPFRWAPSSGPALGRRPGMEVASRRPGNFPRRGRLNPL